MLSTILVKELKAIILSPKFTATFSVCSLLLLLSVYIGINEYKASVRQFDTAGELVGQQLRETRSWHMLSNRIYRAPNPMQVFVTGVNNDIGRTSVIDPTEPVKLTNSTYSDEPVYAVFRFIDFTFVVQVVFSLFAILFTYDSINGERESGTLQLTFANAVPRVRYIVGKFAGSWAGLVVPLSIPILLSLLLVTAYRIPFTGQHWLAIAALIGVSLLYVTFFIAFGVFVSSMTKRSNISFLVCLVTWIFISFIVPRAGVMTAGTLRPVASAAELEGSRDAFAKQAWSQYRDKLESTLQGRMAAVSNKSEAEREAYNEEHQWEWMEQDDKARKAVLKDIDAFGTRLEEEARNVRRQQEQLALVLSRFSPASTYQLAVMTLAGENIDIKSGFENALNSYRTAFDDYGEKKEKESGNNGGIRITVDSQTGFKFSVGRDNSSLDVTDMPQFVTSAFAISEVLPPALPDVALLVGYSFLAFAGAFLAFLRYDIR